MFKVKISTKTLEGKTNVEIKQLNILSFISYLVNVGFRSAVKQKITGATLDIEQVK